MKGFSNSLEQKHTAWLLSLPGIALLFIFIIVPFFMAAILSFTNERLISNPNMPVQFIGLQNYFRIFRSEDFFSALANNFKFSLCVVPVQTGLALLLAVLINKKVPYVNVFRTIYFSPVVITMIVVAIVWALLFNPSTGFINTVIKFISLGHLKPLGWLYDKSTALIAIMILSVWQGVGFQMVIVLAGLQGISAELYEASNMDGAGKFQQFIYVTVPQLKNTLVFILVSTTILSFKLFTQVWILTQGGPENSTMTMVALIYSEGFSKMKVGYASALSVIFFLIVLIISMIQRKVVTREEGY